MHSMCLCDVARHFTTIVAYVNINFVCVCLFVMLVIFLFCGFISALKATFFQVIAVMYDSSMKASSVCSSARTTVRVIISDKGGGKCFCPCSFVCLSD